VTVCELSRIDGILVSVRKNLAGWLRQGISPRRLALTLALGFAIGCFPVVGLPTAICAVLALALRLNLPAIQAANYVAMPLQLLLIVPFVRMGGWLLAVGPGQMAKAGALLHSSPLQFSLQMTVFAGQALLAWALIAVPAVALLTWALTPLLRRVPVLRAAEAGD
jgi:uncharacterized protein (DUF2062 family)